MKRILILLSTYNGEKYLREQLASILNQKDVDFKILIRDDNSNDRTFDILTEFKNSNPDKIRIIKENNIGCRDSFFRLMRIAISEYHDFDYYAFSDQDDIWLEDKLMSGIKKLDSVANEIKLYFCHPQLVDANLNRYGKPQGDIYATLEECFILQPCIGCSMIFSKELLSLASTINPHLTDIHDAWIYRLCLALGGKIVYDKTPHILYRQHGNNTIGSSQSTKQRWLRRLRAFSKSSRFRSGQAKLLLEKYNEYIPNENKQILNILANYNNNTSLKLKILFDKNYKSKSCLHNLLFKIAIIFNKI